MVSEWQIPFEAIMDEYDSIKPRHPEDYYNWRALLNYINKNKAAVQSLYEERGRKGVMDMLFNAEGGELVSGYFGEAYQNAVDQNAADMAADRRLESDNEDPINID